MKKSTLTLLGCLVALSGVAQAQRIATIEIYLSTTTGVRNSVGGTSNSRTLLNVKYDLMRDAEARSIGNINWRRSSHRNTTYNSRNQTSSTQLTRLLSGSQLSGFRSHRDQQNADVGQLFCDWTDSAIGLAFRPGWASICRREVLSVNSGSSPAVWTSAHEFGHSMAATHERGFCMTQDRRTIMETNGGSCGDRRRIGYFSSTRRLNGSRLGNANNNNRSLIRAQAPWTQRQQ